MAELGQEVHPYTSEYYDADLDKLANKLAVAKSSVVEWAVRSLRLRIAVLKAQHAHAEREKAVRKEARRQARNAR